ncbi:zinc metalloproteinase nas-15-like [Oculina patagonica]
MKWLYVLVLCGVALADHDENDVNKDLNLFDGDIKLTGEQRLALALGLDVDNPFGRASHRGRQWPGGVMVFAIHPTLMRSRRARRAIKQGMAEWTRKTCIRFRKRRREAAFAYFVPGRGCSSFVGRSGRRQDITLAPGCWTRGITAHEIGHALGFWHEQSRPDRDRYVKIVWDNIQPRAKHNFRKFGRNVIDTLGTPYDYGSVMHYGPRDFGIRRRITIVPKRRGARIGQRRGISTLDARQMNLRYRGHCRG